MSKLRYEIVSVDVDGDGIHDGHLVIQYKGNKVVSRKFVPLKALKTLYDAVPKKTPRQKQVSIVKDQRPKTPLEQTPKREVLAIEDKTSFGQYVKFGAGAELGREGVSMFTDALGNLFSE